MAGDQAGIKKLITFVPIVHVVVLQCTTQQFHEAQLETNREIAALALTQSEERAAMEIRLLEKLDGIPTQVQTNKDEIRQLRRRSDIIDTVEGLFGVAVAIFLGTRE